MNAQQAKQIADNADVTNILRDIERNARAGMHSLTIGTTLEEKITKALTDLGYTIYEQQGITQISWE